MDWVDFACFYCGRTGHLKANCPDLHRQAPSPSHTATAPRPTLPASHIDVADLRRPPEEIADAEVHANQVRATMGWVRCQDKHAPSRRALAIEQVEESRRQRAPWG